MLSAIGRSPTSMLFAGKRVFYAAGERDARYEVAASSGLMPGQIVATKNRENRPGMTERVANLQARSLDFAIVTPDFFETARILPAKKGRRSKPERKARPMRKPKTSKAVRVDVACGYTDADRAEVMDHPEATDGQLAATRHFREAFPDPAVSIRRARGPQKAPKKELVSLRLDRAVIERFKASGRGWQVRMGDALKKAAGL